MLISARNPFEIVMIFAGLLAGIAGLFSPVIPDGEAFLGIYALHGLAAQVFYPCLVLGTGAVALSLLLRPPMTLLIERVGMILLTALFVPYGVLLIISLSFSLNPSLILVIGYGVACAARSLQITHDLRQYWRELRRITSGSQ
jgi:hypothetical protein